MFVSATAVVLNYIIIICIVSECHNLILVIFADFYVYKSHYLYVSIGGVVFCFSLIFHQVCTSYMYQEKSLDMLIMNCFIRGEIFFRPFILYLKRSNVVEPCLSKVPCVGFIIIRSCCSSTEVAYLKVSYQVILLFFIFFVNSIFITNCIFFFVSFLTA